MREIKFRAWNKLSNKMWKWGKKKGLLGYCLRYGKMFYPLSVAIESNDFILIQYTGLKDRKGKEIYEGDIVANNPRFDNIPNHGKYDSAEIVKMKDIVDCVGYPYYWEDFEVIGNIYENEELLEKSCI